MKTSIIVQNLKCEGCAKTISSKLSDNRKIAGLTVDVESSTISFTADHIDDVLAVTNKLKSLGYPSIDDKNSITTKALSFVSCATGKIPI